MINIQQRDYDILKQQAQTRYIKLNILDFQYHIIDEIGGNLIECSFSVDANSDLRRSCNVSLAVFGKDAYKLSINSTSEIFLDKFIQPYVGIENFRTGEIQWYNQGIYLINRPTWDWDVQTNTLKFDGIDLMAKLTGVRNGQLEGIPHKIPAGSNVREAIIGTLQLGGFTNYVVSECTNSNGQIQDVPNDIEIEQGGTVYDILSQLRDILPSYQIYFDVNGVFHYDLIPNGVDDPIAIDDDLIGQILVSESINTDFEAVKNYIEVWGRSHDIEYYTETMTINGRQISMTFSSIESLKEGMVIGFKLPQAVNGLIEISVNGGPYYAMKLSSGNYVAHLDADVYYCASFTGAAYQFLGHQQARAVAYDNNPDSPFYINGPVGIIRHVCYGGDYDNIQSDELAQERAEYELYLRDRLQDTISLYTIPIPWLDVNVLIRHAAKDETEAKTYMIQSYQYSMGAGETMSIIANQFYPLYA